MAVDIQLCPSHDIQLRRICCFFSDIGRYSAEVDAAISSRGGFDSDFGFRSYTALICFRFARRG